MNRVATQTGNLETWKCDETQTNLEVMDFLGQAGENLKSFNFIYSREKKLKVHYGF